MSTPEQEGLKFRPFVFLGKTLLGAEITDSVGQRMLTESERDDLRHGLLSEDEVASLAAYRFYESVRRTALVAARAAGPGIVACCGRAIWFVKAADWNCACDIDVAESAAASGTAMNPLAVLEHHNAGSVVRLGANRARAILGRCWSGGEGRHPEVSTRGLQHLLEHY